MNSKIPNFNHDAVPPVPGFEPRWFTTQEAIEKYKSVVAVSSSRLPAAPHY